MLGVGEEVVSSQAERLMSIFCAQEHCKDFQQPPSMCTMEYKAHCGSDGKIYGNRCLFCSAYLYVQE